MVKALDYGIERSVTSVRSVVLMNQQAASQHLENVGDICGLQKKLEGRSTKFSSTTESVRKSKRVKVPVTIQWLWQLHQSREATQKM